MLEKNLEFCRAKGIKVREKRWFEPGFLYNLQMSKFDREITNLRLHFECMTKLVNEFSNLYNEIAETAETLGETFMERPSIDIDFSDLKRADKQISERVRYFTHGGRVQNAYKQMYEAERAMLMRARKKFIYNAIQEMPKDKSVVIFTSIRHKPYPYTAQKFWDSVEKLVKEKNKNVPMVYMYYCPEWLAVCPSAHTEVELNNILMSWGGMPNRTTVAYR